MEHFSWLVRSLLWDAFTAPSDEQTTLASLLKECCGVQKYKAIERAVVERIVRSPGRADEPREDLDLGEGVVLAVEHLEALVCATRVAAIRFLQHAVAEVMAPGLDLLWDGKPFYDSGSLVMAGVLLGRWRNQAADNGQQITVLRAFQDAGWPRWIPTPFTSEDQATNTCKNLNRKLGGTLHFSASFDRITWARCVSNTELTL